MASKFKIVSVIVAVLVCTSLVVSSGYAASTTKTLSTNFTLVNLGDDIANVNVQYLLANGSTWPNVSAANKSFSLAPNGGQIQIRQYTDTMDPGSGSALVTSNMQLGAIAQIQARNQVATLGAYMGLTEGKSSFYAPLLARRGYSLSGTVNAQVIIQNTGSSPVDVLVEFSPNPKANGDPYTKQISGISPGVSYYYDLDDETLIKENWFGSAVVSVAPSTPSGTIGVIVNVFMGTNGLQTYNAFSPDQLDDSWVVPIFASRLTNGLSTVVTIQNLSGSEMAVGDVTLTCVNESNVQLFTPVTNHLAIPDKGGYSFNPASDTTRFPTNVYGSCTINSTGKNFIAYVQMRFVNVLPNESTAAYEAIPTKTTTKSFFVPLIAKRLSNGFATVVNIANLANENNTVHIDYIPSPTECPVAICDKNSDGVVNASDTISPTDPVIGPMGGNQRNHRFSQETVLPDGWVGSMRVNSVSNLPISGVVQLTYYNTPPGDTYMAHGVFGK